MDAIAESISWLGVISLGAGGVLQLVSRHLSKRAAFLDQATSVDNLAGAEGGGTHQGTGLPRRSAGINTPWL